MAENRKLLYDKFEEHVDVTYLSFCQQHHIQPSTHALLTFLIGQGLIPDVAIKRFTIQKEFTVLSKKEQAKKTKMVNALSDKFNIPERSVWGLLKKK